MRGLSFLLLVILLFVHEGTTQSGSIDCTPRDEVILQQMFQESEQIHKEHDIEHQQTMNSLMQDDPQLRQSIQKAVVEGGNEYYQQILLSLAGSPTSMQLSFISKTLLANPQIQLSKNIEMQQEIVMNATTTTYDTDINFSKPFIGFTGYIYQALFTSLQPQTQYFYQVGNGVSGGNWSEVYNFTTGAITMEEFSFAAFGDMGTFPGGGIDGRKTTELMISHLSELSLVIHAGDIAYAYVFFTISILKTQRSSPSPSTSQSLKLDNK